MNYITTYLLIFLLVPASTGAQETILEKKIRLQNPETTVKAYLKTLESAGGFTFSYGKDVPALRMVKPGERDLTVDQHLQFLFKNDSLTWSERGNKVLIMKKATRNAAPGQTIRGRIIDAGSRAPISGANILLFSEGPSRGGSSDANGNFRFDDTQPGWHELQFSFVGYRPVSAKSLVSSGKESVLEITMEEVPFQIGEVEINSRREMSAPLNRLSVVSGRSFSAYEVENYPGSISDISRAAVSYPGVVSTNDGQNHIMIRGNSPKGLSWRLEGIEIPNLNHFSDIGASGGGVSVLSNNMLDRSDFLTGAFPAEYGNALSGVFDLRLRTGNNEQHERTIQLGLLGLEAMVEGPVNRESGATYIAQYRYSTLKLFKKAGFELESVPDFQDLSFKFFIPTRKTGTFSVFGIGGLSTEKGENGYDLDSDMYTMGISHAITPGPGTFLKSVLAISGRTFAWHDTIRLGATDDPVLRERTTDILDQTLRGSVLLNQKLGTLHRLRAGINYEMAWNQSYMGWKQPDMEHSYIDTRGHAATLEGHLNWSWDMIPGLTMNTGGHFTRFYLNGNTSLEPRLGLEWHPAPRHRISAAFGIHSRKECLTLYMGERTLGDGTTVQPNLDLELSKAQHYVLGYAYAFSSHLSLGTELYYQHLYDIPASPFPPYFTTMNFDFGFEGSPLLNYGTGYNTGIEVNLEKQMHRGLSLLWNASIYDSKYQDRTGRWLNTKYNGRYTSNGVIVREFKVGKSKQHTFSVSSRYILAGGLRYLPIDEEASAASGWTVRIWDDGFTGKWDDYFRIDLMFKFRRNHRKFTSEWSLDFQNIINRQNALSNYWDTVDQKVRYTYQNPLLLFVNYRIQF